MSILVLLRHGQSIENKKKIISGWTSSSLTHKGRRQAQYAAKILKDISFDVAFTSTLFRAQESLEIVLKNQKKIPIVTSWRLNERHTGKWQGMTHAQIIEQAGETAFMKRRTLHYRLPQLEQSDPRHLKHFKAFHKIEDPNLPNGESLMKVWKRVQPFWQKRIYPDIKKGKNILICSHEHTTRMLMWHIEKMTKKQVEELVIPNCDPIYYKVKKGNIKRTNK